MVNCFFTGICWKKIFNGYHNKKDVIYVPGIWKILMSIILLIPERKKLDF